VATKVEPYSVAGIISAMAISGQKCWITAGSIPLKEATVVDLDDKRARLILSDMVLLPPECSLFFTYNCTVGRKCKVTRQMGTQVSVSFLGRIGPPELAKSDIIKID
jgi:hypothetical protein